METAEGLFVEQGDRVWGSMVKQTLKRRRPGFDEHYYGFQSLSHLLEAAADRGLLQLEIDRRSGGYMILAIHRYDYPVLLPKNTFCHSTYPNDKTALL